MRFAHLRRTVNIACVAAWGLLSALYYVGKRVVELNGLEYREWVNNWYVLLFWLIPLALIGVNLWIWAHRKRGHEKHRGLKFLCFAIYCFLAVLFFCAALFLYALKHDTTEVTLDDGNYRIRVSEGYGSVYYYAEPVKVFTRKAFTWDRDRYAESLSKIYDAQFQYAGDDEDGNPQFTASEYFDIRVTVYGIDDDGPNELDENLRYMVTSARLQEEWDTYFTHGEEAVLFLPRLRFPESSQQYSVYALVVSSDKLEETAEDIAAFIRNECQNAVRADGEPLYENLNGSIYLLFQEVGTSDYVGARNFAYGYETSIAVHDESVTAEDILPVLERGFQ